MMAAMIATTSLRSPAIWLPNVLPAVTLHTPHAVKLYCNRWCSPAKGHSRLPIDLGHAEAESWWCSAALRESWSADQQRRGENLRERGHMPALSFSAEFRWPIPVSGRWHCERRVRCP